MEKSETGLSDRFIKYLMQCSTRRISGRPQRPAHTKQSQHFASAGTKWRESEYLILVRLLGFESADECGLLVHESGQSVGVHAEGDVMWTCESVSVNWDER